MTVPIEIANIGKNSVLSALSRYQKQNLIYYGEQKYLTFDLYLRQPYKLKGDEKVMLITKGIEYRPDLVAQQVYGVVDVWWRILEVNKMKDIWDFKAGETIVLPDSIYFN